LKDKPAISLLSRDSQTGWLTFLWQNDDGTVEAGFYRPHQTELFSALVQNPLKEQVAWVPSAMSTIPAWNAERHVFPSPTGQAMSVRFGHRDTVLGPRHDYSLQLTTTNKRPAQVVRSGLAGLNNPLWSPDGDKLAIIGHPPLGSYPYLEIWSAGGRLLTHIEQFTAGEDTNVWTRCD